MELNPIAEIWQDPKTEHQLSTAYTIIAAATTKFKKEKNIDYLTAVLEKVLDLISDIKTNTEDRKLRLRVQEDNDLLVKKLVVLIESLVQKEKETDKNSQQKQQKMQQQIEEDIKTIKNNSNLNEQEQKKLIDKSIASLSTKPKELIEQIHNDMIIISTQMQNMYIESEKLEAKDKKIYEQDCIKKLTIVCTNAAAKYEGDEKDILLQIPNFRLDIIQQIATRISNMLSETKSDMNNNEEESYTSSLTPKLQPKPESKENKEEE